MGDFVMKSFEKELEDLINRHCMENASDTPDFILAYYLKSCLDAFDTAVRRRTEWYGKPSDSGPMTDVDTVTVHSQKGDLRPSGGGSE